MGNISLAQRYLEDKVSGGSLSNYSMCLVAYALALANSPVAGAALNELRRRADLIGEKPLLCKQARSVQKCNKPMQLWCRRWGDDVELLGWPAVTRLAPSLCAGGDDLLRAAGAALWPRPAGVRIGLLVGHRPLARPAAEPVRRLLVHTGERRRRLTGR